MDVGNSVRAPSVLVVEDEALLLMLVAETLREAGYKVYEASNGMTAMAELEASTDIHLMISDIRMPGMSGYQVADAARTLRPDLKVVLMTGYTEEAIPKSISDAGIPVLRKPFNVDEIPSLANRMLGR